MTDSVHTDPESDSTDPTRREGGRWTDEIAALDEAISDAVSKVSTPTLDVPIRLISNAANYGRLWFAIAGVLAALGGRRGRATALRGVIAWGVTSLVADQALKALVPRRRPTPTATAAREVRVPPSSSFPSGHTASAFGFAAAVTADVPALAIPLFGLASVVGYSRVHGGVHYPSDVIAGSVFGLAAGTAVHHATLRRGPLSMRARD